MARILKVRPTKIELVKLKRRLRVSQRVQKIMKDRLSILTMEFLRVAREAVGARKRMNEASGAAYRAMTVAGGFHGYMTLEKELVASASDIAATAWQRSVAGIRLPVLKLEEPAGGSRGYNPAQTSSLVDHAADRSREALRAIVGLAELERCLELLGAEINRTKRITNALEHLVVPDLRETIRFLAMKFEERDREEKSRLKRVKVLLARKAG